MPDPISRALLNRVLILLLLSAALYHLPEAAKSLRLTIDKTSDMFSKDAKAASTDLTSSSISGLNASKGITSSFPSLFDEDPSFLTKNKVPVLPETRTFLSRGLDLQRKNARRPVPLTTVERIIFYHGM